MQIRKFYPIACALDTIEHFYSKISEAKPPILGVLILALRVTAARLMENTS